MPFKIIKNKKADDYSDRGIDKYSYEESSDFPTIESTDRLDTTNYSTTDKFIFH